jgi:polysaccharide pyruvyl transferase WcaK-like protein
MSVPIGHRIRIEDQIRAMAQHLRQRGYERISLLCHDHRDIPFAASFGDLDYIYTDDVYEYLSLLRHARLNITYRLHSFLPCLSYGTPAIKISYDQRATSVLEMIGMDEWNVDMIRDPDPLSAVLGRIDRLDELAGHCERAAGAWSELRTTQIENVGAFADSVREYQRRNGAALAGGPVTA